MSNCEVEYSTFFILTVVSALLCAKVPCCQALDSDLLKISPYYGVVAVAASGNASGSPACIHDLRRVADGIDARKRWALILMDASGSPANRLHWGYNRWFGSKSQCLLATEGLALNLSPNQGALPVTMTDDLSPVAVRYYAAYFQHNSKMQMKIRWQFEDIISLTLCLPSSCGDEEIAGFLQTYFDSGQFYFQNLYNTSLQVQFVKDKTGSSIQKETSTIILLIVMLSTVSLCILGTVYDVCEKTILSRLNSIHTLVNGANHSIAASKVFQNGDHGKELETSGRFDAAGRCLICFSIIRNFKLITEQNYPNKLPEISGLRFLSILYVLLGHANIFILNYADTKIYAYHMTSYFLLQIIANGQLAVDSFFTISGFLVGYSFFRNFVLKKYQNISTVEFIKGNIVKRYLRLTPIYIVVILLGTVLSMYQYSSSPFLVTDRYDLQCPRYWWRNLLYINNFYPPGEMCLVWSWYLSADFQFYALCTLVCAMYIRRPKMAIALIWFLLTAAMTITGYLSYSNGLHATLDEFANSTFLLHFAPWVHFGAYAVGFLTGYLLMLVNQNIVKLKLMFMQIGWVCVPVLNIIVLFGLYYRQMSPMAFAWYMALSRTAWGLSVSWIMFACVTGYGGIVSRLLSKKFWHPLGTLGYGIFMIHPLIMYLFYGESEAPWHLSLFPSFLLTAGFLLLILIASLVLLLIFEIPYAQVTHLILTSTKARSTQKKEL